MLWSLRNLSECLLWAAFSNLGPGNWRAEIPLLGLYIPEEEPALNSVSPDSPPTLGMPGDHFGRRQPEWTFLRDPGPLLPRPACMCSSITLCFKMRLGSGDSGHLSTLLVQPATAQHQPLRSLVWGLISVSRQDSRKEQPIWCRTTRQMLRAGTGRVKPSLSPACPPAALASAAWNPWGPVGPS